MWQVRSSISNCCNSEEARNTQQRVAVTLDSVDFWLLIGFSTQLILCELFLFLFKVVKFQNVLEHELQPEFMGKFVGVLASHDLRMLLGHFYWFIALEVKFFVDLSCASSHQLHWIPPLVVNWFIWWRPSSFYLARAVKQDPMLSPWQLSPLGHTKMYQLFETYKDISGTYKDISAFLQKSLTVLYYALCTISSKTYKDIWDFLQKLFTNSQQVAQTHNFLWLENFCMARKLFMAR